MGLLDWFRKKIGKGSGKIIGGTIGNIVGGRGGKFVGKNVGGLIAETCINIVDSIKSTKSCQLKSIRTAIKNSDLNLVKLLANQKDLNINSEDRFDLIKYSIEYRDKRIVKFLIENSIKSINRKFKEIKKLDKKLKNLKDKQKKIENWIKKEGNKKINQLINKVFPKLYKKYKLGKINEENNLSIEITERKEIYSEQKIGLTNVNFKNITKEKKGFLENYNLNLKFDKLNKIFLDINKQLNLENTPLIGR